MVRASRFSVDLLLEILLAKTPRLGGLISLRVVLHFDGGRGLLLVQDGAVEQDARLWLGSRLMVDRHWQLGP